MAYKYEETTRSTNLPRRIEDVDREIVYELTSLLDLCEIAYEIKELTNTISVVLKEHSVHFLFTILPFSPFHTSLSRLVFSGGVYLCYGEREIEPILLDAIKKKHPAFKLLSNSLS